MELISYAQNYEDIRLWRAFRDVENGRYLDIGTQEPNRDSVSRLFYDRGWRGVHVEPTPSYAAEMRGARPDETVIEAAVSSSPLPIVLFEIPGTGLSTGIPEIARFHQEAGWSFQEILVPTISLASLLEFMGEDPIHWLKIDVEGMEADVLASWGDHPARPAALVVEATKPNTQEPTHATWHEMVTSRGYHEVLFDGLSRYFIHESHAERGDALALSPNVFDGFQVLRSHFSAGRIAAEIEQTVAHLHDEAEASARDHAAQLAQVTADASAQIDAALQRAGELEGRLASEAEAHAHALAGAHAAAAEASAQLDAALQRAGELEGRLASESEAHARALAGAQAAAAEASAQLDAALQRAGELETQLAADAAAHAAELAQAASKAADTQAKLEDALGKADTLEQRLAAETATHLAASARASAALAEMSGKLEVAQTRSAELQGRLQEQARQHAAALRMADERTAAATRALAEANGKLIDLHAEQLALGRLSGRLEGQLAAQEKWYATHLADATSQRDELRARLELSEQALAALRVAEGELRADLAAEVARGEAASSAAAAERDALEVQLAATGDEARRATEQVAELTTELAIASEQRDALAAKVHELEEARDNLARELDAFRSEAAEVGAALRQEIDGLQATLARQDKKLLEAQDLLANVPDPLTGASGARRALMRWAIGSSRLSAMADYQALAMGWQDDAAWPTTATPLGDECLDCAPHEPHAQMIKLGAAMLTVSGPITSVADLLATNGRTFIHAAYWSVLGRAPDAEGEAYYMARLRAGRHKLSILKQMRRSPEGRAFVPAVAGLDRALERHHLANLPLIGFFLAPFIKADRDSSTNIAMRRLEQSVIAEIAWSNTAIASGELKGALDWVDARIGRLLEYSADLDARAKDMQGALERITAELHASGSQERLKDGSSASAAASSGSPETKPLRVHDLQDRTGMTSVEDVLRRIELEIS